MSTPPEATAAAPLDAPSSPTAAPRKVVEARDIGVCYHVANPQAESRGLAGRWFKPRQPFWALKNVSFHVEHGSMFYIIGRNGAGKTTLLRVLAETLEPDAGELSFVGKVTAFLSMGLGFNQELTGKDNMELALTLMGVDRATFPERREEIDAFTQLGPFLEMPIKTYSAGMRARLGFAIATSIEPEVLIMDEVINAGDEQFRDAARVRLESMLGKARAIIIATHSLRQVRDQAHAAMWIEAGRVQGFGDPNDIVDAYQGFVKAVRQDPFYDAKARAARFAGEEPPIPTRSAAEIASSGPSPEYD
ncbi:MAG: ATP-binding cassette domain-containing protein [Planctomycetota bacterium]